MKAHLLILGQIPLVVTCERISPQTVRFPPVGYSIEVFFDLRAEDYTNLIVFEGYMVRDGMPGGCKALNFIHQGKLYRPGEFVSTKRVTAGKVKPFDHLTGLPRDQDEVTIVDGMAEFRFGMFALQFPRGKDGSRGLIMRPKPMSLERDYLRILSTPERVLFESCVTF